MHVITEIDPKSGAIFARNPYNTAFRDRTAFFDVDEASRTVTGDRTEFLGHNGTLRDPAAMTRMRLSGKVGAALDPCAAIQVGFDLTAGQEREIVFRLGVGRDAGDASNLVNRFRGSTAARGALDVVWQHWTHCLGVVNVETPDQSLNVLANGWLLYQTLACRLWARSGYYQSRRRLRFPGSVAGLDGAHPRQATSRARALAPVRVPSIHGRRRPALVASSNGSGCSYSLFGRLPLAAARDVPLCPHHRGHRRVG